MRLTDFETGLPVRLEWREVVAFKADHPKLWLKTQSGRVWCVRETMREIDAKATKGGK
jgi:hypothetical protein